MTFLTIILPLTVALTGEVQTADKNLAVRNYESYLHILDNGDLNSISKGLQKFQDDAVSLDLVRIDSLASIFITFYVATIALHNDRMWEDLDFMERLHQDDNRTDSTLSSFYRDLAFNGLGIYDYGRLQYLDQTDAYLFQEITPFVSTSFRRYLYLRMQELKVGFSDHDSLSITFKQVGERVLHWEHFLVRYPNSSVHDRANYYYKTYLSTLLTGLSNSPAFDKNGNLHPELVILYDDYSKRHSATLSGSIVKQFYESLVEGRFRWSPEVRQFYEAHAIRNMHRAQVPLR